jgi:hypothetical protein
MKKICAILGLALCVGGAAFAVERNVEPMQQTVSSTAQPETGPEVIAVLRAGYAEGSFNSFLDGLEGDYRDLEKSGRLQEFAEMRQAPEPDSQLKDLATHYEVLAGTLLKQRNIELKEVCKGQEEAIACKRVQSATSELDLEQQEAMRYLANLRFKTPEQATNDDERKLIEIDLAYEFKLVHLDAQRLSGEETTLDQKQIVLGMDKIEKMQDVSKGFSDQALKKKVDLAAKGFDAWQSKGLDMRELAAAAKKPSGDLERKIGSVLSSYKAKKDDLYQKEFLAKLDTN